MWPHQNVEARQNSILGIDFQTHPDLLSHFDGWMVFVLHGLTIKKGWDKLQKLIKAGSCIKLKNYKKNKVWYETAT